MAYEEKYEKSYGKGYGKQPLWQWILIYIVVGGLIYWGIYYFFIAKRGGYKPSGTYSTPGYISPGYTAPAGTATPTSTSTATNPIYK